VCPVPRQAPRIVLDPYELLDLRRLARAPSTAQANAFRARLILGVASRLASHPVTGSQRVQLSHLPKSHFTKGVSRVRL
jgi:hypothetical protein